MSTPYRQATWKKWFGVTFFVGTTQVPFWILYPQTGNIVTSMGITAVITIGVSAVLYWLGQVDKRKQGG